ncbi:venom factor-like [Antedon mediterranea]|uniref:venom factor-like n=1 Tax=Antedon mediterranea TaxID=105859 RepID=UPI003AF75EC9
MFGTGLIIFVTLLQNCLGNPPSYLITSPDVLRVGSQATALINIFNTDETIPVQLYLENYPNRENRFAEVSVDVTAVSPKIVTFQINLDDIVPTEAELQYVYLVAKSESPALTFTKESRILVTYRHGYVFIQTDKPIYTPEQHVRIRVIPLTMDMLPSTDQFRFEIINGNGNILEKEDAVTAEEETGFYTHAYQFPKFPVFGNWTVKVSYGYMYQLESSVTFEVKEYVLPTFGIRFTGKPEYILPSSLDFVVSFKAEYIYGKPVEGVYNFHVGYVGSNDDPVIIKKFRGELQSNGEILIPVMLQSTVDDFDFLVGKKLHLEAVVRSSDSKTEKIIDNSIPFANSAYILETTDTVQYFKPGLPYEIKFKLLFVNNKPAPHTGVHITAKVDGEPLMFSQGDFQLEPNTNGIGEVKARLDIPENANILTITIRPTGLPSESENGMFEVTINKHVTSSGDYILIKPFTQHFLPDNTVDFDILFSNDALVDRIYFMIVSKGKILEKGTTHVGGVRVTLTVPITYEMTPSARIITYFVDNNNKIVADSLYLDVLDECENQVRLRADDDEYVPDDAVEFTLYAKPKTSIGLVAVDEAVLQLRDTDRLSFKKMFETMEKFDLGCGPGGGLDAQSVFEDSGLTTTSDIIETDLKLDFGCKRSQRRRRSVPYVYRDETDQKLITICEMGYRIIDDWTCERRTERISKVENLKVNDPIVQRFYNCCRLKVMDGMNRGRTFSGSDIDDVNVLIAKDVSVRSNFLESFLFENVVMKEDSMRYDFSLPSSITKWQIQAVSVSPNYGMCVADPLTLTAFLDFFIQLDIPYSIVRGEQVEIQATVFNYQRQDLRVFMYLEGTDGICSEALPGQRSKNKKDFTVSSQDSYTVTYPMIPLRVGEFKITVLAFTFSKHDAVTKILRVIPEGVTRYITMSQILDPIGKLNGQPANHEEDDHDMFQAEQIRSLENEKQTDIIDIRLPPDAIDGTAHCKIRITGTVMGPTISAIVDDLDKMIKKPTGCGEQTLIRMGPNVFVTKYLTQTNQMTSDFERKAFRYLRMGYAMELTFFKPNGAFSLWGPSSKGEPYLPGDTSSTWLTAFGTKILCHAKDLIYVDPDVICRAIGWLTNPEKSEVQRDDGAFKELFRVHHREMTGGVQGDVSFTAYVLITLLECDICDEHTQQAKTAIDKAVMFLETEFEKGAIVRPYAVAITAYALTLANSRVKQTINEKLRDISTYKAGSPKQIENKFQSSIPIRYWGVDDSTLAGTKKPFWYVRRPSAISVETTSYALLTQVLNNDIEYSNPIVSWLTEQRNYDGGFVSTQDTVIALQALNAYSDIIEADELNLQCTITTTTKDDEDYKETISVQATNALHHQEKTPPVNGFIVIDTTGSGIGQAQVEVRYNSDAKTPSEHCSFDVEASASTLDDREWVAVNGRIAAPTEVPEKVGIDMDCSRDKIGGNCPDEEDVTNSPDNSRSRVGRSTSSSYMLNIRACARYHGHEKTGMSIIEVGIYSGFRAKEEDLELILKEIDLVKKYEFQDRSVVFYLDSIPRDERVCVNFRAERVIVVSAIQPVAVHVYDYYEPEEKCTDFYHPEPGSDLLNLLCTDADMCICAAGNCALCNSKKTKSQLIDEACSQNRDYAFEITVNNVRETESFDVYNCTVQVIKNGVDDIESTADENGIAYREFWKSRKCRCPEIQANKKYLIIGVDGLKTTDKDGLTVYKYLIDDQTYVEYWPGVGRNGKQAKKRLKKLNGLKAEMQENGCGI